MKLVRTSWLVVALASIACAGPAASDPGESTGESKPVGSLTIDSDVPDPYRHDPLEYPVDAQGPFRVGYRVVELTYEPGGLGTQRTIPVHVWYPTLDTGGAHPQYAYYLPKDPGSIVDASLAPSPYADGKYPVHLYSHGRAHFGPSAFPLMIAFASHGWVAVAPDHVGSTLGDNVKNPDAAWKYYTRPLDLGAALDHLDALPSSDPLSEKLRTAAVLMSGHSSGVFTTWAIAGASFDMAALEGRCEAGQYADGCSADELELFKAGFRDPRVVAAIGMGGRMSPIWFGSSGHGSVGIPMFAMSGSDDVIDVASLFEQVDGLDFTWLDIAGGCHYLFAYGGCENIDDEVGFRIVATYARAFARRHVLGDDDPMIVGLLDGSQQLSPLVAFARK